MTGHGPGSERVNDATVPEKVHWHDKTPAAESVSHPVSAAGNTYDPTDPASIPPLDVLGDHPVLVAVPAQARVIESAGLDPNVYLDALTEALVEENAIARLDQRERAYHNLAEAVRFDVITDRASGDLRAAWVRFKEATR